MPDAQKGLGFFDCLTITSIWVVIGLIAYVTQDHGVMLISLIPGYYLSKWIILKKIDGPKS